MTAISAGIGGFSSVLGVIASAVFPRLAAGAVIVLAGTALFLVSLLFGTRRGVLLRAVQRFRRDRHIGRDHLLRALFECLEPRLALRDPEPNAGDVNAGERHAAAAPGIPESELVEQLATLAVPWAELLAHRSWSPNRLRRLLRSAHRTGLIVRSRDPSHNEASVQLTRRGAAEACRVVRNHRLWEIYLIEYTDRSQERVDRDADWIEHDLGPEVVARLERMLDRRLPRRPVPPSPHAIPASPEALAK
jgi:manganese/zinc/iron transport system permease protein